MEICAKGMRVTEMAHTLKSQRDEYQSAKRQSAEMKIFRELRKISRVSRETYLLARQNHVEISNIKKCFNAFQEIMETVVGKEEVESAIVKQRLEPIPERPDLEDEATRLDNYLEDPNEEDDFNNTLVIDEGLEDSVIVDELYEGIWNPDSSVLVDDVIPLTKEQALDKERRLDVEEKLKSHKFQDCGEGGWSFERYVDLQTEIQSKWSPVTISKPINPKVFRKRYGKDWDESMNLHADFGGTRGEGPRIQKPQGWRARRDQERADNATKLEEIKATVKKTNKGKGKGKSSTAKPSDKYKKHAPVKVKTKAELKFIQENNPADNEKVDEVFDDSSDSSGDDFQMERSPVKLRGQEKLKAMKRKAEEPVAGFSGNAKKQKTSGSSISRQIAKFKVIPQ